MSALWNWSRKSIKLRNVYRVYNLTITHNRMTDQKQTKLRNKMERMLKTKTFRIKDQNQWKPTKDQTFKLTIC